MQKIRDEIVKKMYRLDTKSKYTLIIMLELISIASEQGEVEIYYKDIVDKIGCTISTFYEVIKSLSDLNFIEIKKADFKSDIHVKIINNDFTSEKGYKNYIDTNSVFFADKKYKELGAGAIKTYLFLMYRVLKAGAKSTHGEENVRKEKNKLKYNESTSYAKIAIQLCLCPLNTNANKVPKKDTRAVKKYINQLIKHKLIAYGTALKEDKNTYITVEKWALATPTVELTEKGKVKAVASKPLFTHWKHLVGTICRRNKKIFDEQNLCDTAILINQYENKAKEQNRDIYKMIANAIAYFENEMLDSKAVHAIIKKMVSKDYAYDILVHQ